jgi:3-hydroxyacyl-[acyl-carrier-protein] dehydratase
MRGVIIDGQAATKTQEGEPWSAAGKRQVPQGEAAQGADVGRVCHAGCLASAELAVGGRKMCAGQDAATVSREVPIVAGKDLIIDISTIDFSAVIADIHEIRKYNPQRFEMEHLTAIVYEDTTRHICVGYKDVTAEEFWIRGHMPNMPLMPGVVMLEAAAQMCSYYVQKQDLMGAEMVGFGGLEDVRFRDPVRPGSRLILLSQLIKARRGRMLVSQFQGVVGDSVVVEGVLKGVPIPVEMLQRLSGAASGR